MKPSIFRFLAIGIGLAAVARLLLPLAVVPRGFIARIDAGGSSVERIDVRLGFGGEGEPQLPSAPFSAIWQGYLNIGEQGPQKFYGHSPGGTTEIILDSRTITIAPAGFWAVDVPAEPGVHRLLVRLSASGEGPPRFDVGRILDGREEPFDGRTVFRAQPSARRLAVDRAATGAIRVDDFLLAALILAALGFWATGLARSLRAPTRREVLWGTIAVGALASLVAAYQIATLQLILGSSEGRQIYQYVEEFTPRSLVVALVAAIIAAGLLSIPDRLLERRQWSVVGLWALAGTGLQALLRSLTPFSFERIFINDGANSFYGATLRFKAGAVLSDFNNLRFDLPLHAYSNMPGKLMLVYALEYLSKNPATLAWLVVAVSNVGGLFLYACVRDLFGDRRIALFSYVLYLFVPAKLYFFPLLNAVTPAVVCGCAFLLVRWLQGGSARYAALLGAALYGLTFFEPLALTTGLLFAALVAWAIMRRQLGWQTFLRQSAVVLAAFAATYLGVMLAFHFNLFDAMRQVGGDAVGFNDRFERPYGIWVRQNIPDFLFGVGICQALIFWIALGDSLTRGGAWRERLSQPIAAVSVSVAAILLVIDVMGMNRGEIIRLWIFLACLFQIPTAYVCARLESRTAIVLVVALTILQDALGTSMIGFIQA